MFVRRGGGVDKQSEHYLKQWSVFDFIEIMIFICCFYYFSL